MFGCGYAALCDVLCHQARHQRALPAGESSGDKNQVRMAWLVVVVSLVVGCGTGSSPRRSYAMPSPDGCYLQVWAGPGFNGASEFINGPRRYEHLRDLPGGLNWKGRIRSVRVGPAARAIAWSNEGFEGTSLLLSTDRPRAEGFATLPVDVESLDVRCASAEPRLADTAAGSQGR
jgi:hypothetical protein